MRPSFVLFILLSLMAGCQSEHRETVELGGGKSLTMSIMDLFSLQSDWERSLTISSSEQHLTVNLFSDTGWWRGSSLYLHKSGRYVLQEGQVGCTVFQFSPPELVTNSRAYCVRKDPSEEPRSDSDSWSGFIQSRHYRDLYFIGLFFEANGAEKVLQFNPASQQVEPLMPSPL